MGMDFVPAQQTDDGTHPIEPRTSVRVVDNSISDSGCDEPGRADESSLLTYPTQTYQHSCVQFLTQREAADIQRDADTRRHFRLTDHQHRQTSAKSVEKWIKQRAEKASLDYKSYKIRKTLKFLQDAVNAILGRMRAANPLWRLRRMDHGSMAEGVKTNGLTELDCLCELQPDSLDACTLTLEHHEATNYNPAQGDNCLRKSYVKVKFTDPVPDEWKPYIREDGVTINSLKLQRDFSQAICRAMSQGSGNQNCRYYFEENGPSITVYVKLPKDLRLKLTSRRCSRRRKRFLADPGREVKLVKIDLVLAIPLKNSHNVPVKLNPGIPGLRDEKCHLIPSGSSVWQISYAEFESETVRKLPVLGKNIIRALKDLRDQVSVAGEFEHACLSSYPIKVATLKEHAREDFSEHCDLLDRLQRVLNALQKGNMTSYTIQDDPVFLQENRSHLEVRRMVVQLEKDLRRRCFTDWVLSVCIDVPEEEEEGHYYRAPYTGKRFYCVLGIMVSWVAFFILCVSLLFTGPLPASLPEGRSLLIRSLCSFAMLIISHPVLILALYCRDQKLWRSLGRKFLVLTSVFLLISVVLVGVFSMRLYMCYDSPCLQQWWQPGRACHCSHSHSATQSLDTTPTTSQ